MDRGDIFLVSLDPASGHEQKGLRPVLVVTPERFNRLTGTPVVVPITTGGRVVRRGGFAASLSGAGTKTTGGVGCDQPRGPDIEARRARKREHVRAPYGDEGLAPSAT